MVANDAPFKQDNTTPEDGYRDGYETGLSWKDKYRPGGPYIFRADRYERDAEWAEYCARSAEINRQWLLGFDAGLADQKK